MPFWLKTPHMTVGSDAMWATEKRAVDDDPALFAGHPRTSGSHTKVLRMAREEGVPLMFTLAQLSYWSAKHLGDAGLESMKIRGRMQEGMIADIAIFDPKNVKEGSDYKVGEQGLPPIGLPHVIVNGVFVKRDEKPTGATPGLPIRYAVETNSRHVSATQKQWLNNFTIDSGALAPKAKTPTSNDNKKTRLAPDPQPHKPIHSGESKDLAEWLGNASLAKYSMLNLCELHQTHHEHEH